MRLGRIQNLNRQLFAQGAKSGLELIEPGTAPQVEQAIHLRRLPVQPLG